MPTSDSDRSVDPLPFEPRQFRGLVECARVLNRQFGASVQGAETALAVLRSRHALTWSQFRTRWLASVSGPELVIDEDSGSVTILANRTTEGGFIRTRLSVFATLELLLGSAVPNRLLHDWYRADLRREFSLADTIECTDFTREWLARFNDLKQDSCDREVLASLVPDHTQWADGLIEGLEYLAIIGFNSDPRRPFRLNLAANQAWVLANILGYSTGNGGLDSLLYGALRVPEDRLGVVIAGSSGMGKSTLALTLGAQCCARGGYCHVYQTEVVETAIERQLHKFSGDLLPFFDTVTGPPREFVSGNMRQELERVICDPNVARTRGFMRISRVSSAAMEHLDEAVLSTGEEDPAASGCEGLRFPELMVILDSISAMRGYGEPASEWRSLVFDRVTLLRSRGFTVVLVVESNDLSAADFETYLADVVIRLERSVGADKSNYFRALEVLKSRAQVAHRGVHRYSIRDRVGLAISPSSAASLRSLGHRGKQYYAQRPSVAVPVRGVATYLGGVSQVSQADDRSVPVLFWKASSLTLCVGGRDSFHDAFARQFLDLPDAQRPSALSIGFWEPTRPELCHVERKNRSSFPFGVRYEIGRGPVGKDLRRPAVVYLGFRGGAALTPEDVLASIRDVLQNLRRQQIGVGRASVSDLATLPAIYPTLAEDPSFLECLFELLVGENATTAAVLSEPEIRNKPESVGPFTTLRDRLEALADNVIRFATVGAPGRQRQSIRVERSSDNSHDRGVYEIRRLGPNAGLEISPSFDLLLDPFSDEPKDAPIHVFLHSETQAQEDYHKRYQEREESFGTLGVHLADRTVPSYSISLGRRVLGSPGLFIVQVDNRHLPLRYQEGERSLLVDLGRYLEVSDLAAQLVAAPVWGSSRRKRQYIPYYLNPPLLTATPELFAYFVREHPRIARGDGNYSWADLVEATNHFAKHEGLSDVPVMGEPPGADSLNCLFLEILASLWPGFWAEPRVEEWFHARSPYLQIQGHDGKPLLSAARILLTLLRGNGETASRSERQPLLRREWYSYYRSAPVGRKAMLLPGGVCVCGDWYFGIIDGSVAVRTGVRLILDQFVNPAAGVELMHYGVGLTPFRQFYNEMSGEVMPGLKLSRFAPYVNGKGVIYRSLLRGYAKVDPLLRMELAEMLRIANSSNEPLEPELEARFTFLNEVIETGSRRKHKRRSRL